MTPSKTFLSIITGALLLSGCVANTIEEFDNRATLENPDKYMAFVGEKIQVVEFDPAEDYAEEVLIMDSAFKARYRILELVHGEYDGETVDFKAYDHYGFPHFAKRNIAMLYLTEYEGALYHVKYAFHDVYPTIDGRYAFCGNPYFTFEEEDEIDPRPLERITFSPPVVMRISDHLMDEEDKEYYSDDEIAEHRAKVYEFFSAPDFEVKGDHATCKRGVYPDELFRIIIETRILPQKRWLLCEEKLESEGFEGDFLARSEARLACIADMKAKNLPGF